jgi:anion-transporting  ArsA/GET3 family ATPase
MAMEKLGQLRASEQWDLIIVDTPPSRSALDFLDAPNRMSRFLDGTMIRLLTAPSRAGFKFASAGFVLFSRIVSKILGGQLLRDISAFVAALDTMFGGFRERADITYALLKEPTTAFVVVAAPERDALREAAYFVDRLESEGMPLAGVVVNRMQTLAAPALSGSRAAAASEQLEDRSSTADDGDDLAGLTPALLRLHADLAAVATRHDGHVRRFVAGHPGVRLSTVPASATDIHDLEGLRTVGAALASG